MNAFELDHRGRIESLLTLGYTQREAAFLDWAGLHSGYFLRRQFVRFIGKAAGGTAAAFIERALAFGHIKALTYTANVHLYHLCSRRFYTALAQPNNRNRRDRQPLTIKAKLMALDYVLANTAYTYLATEQEKFEYFTAHVGLEPKVLPQVVFGGADDGSSTRRYFIDKFPIYLETLTDEAIRPTFCYVDPGATTVSGFETYLSRYHGLFSCLEKFRLVYVATRPLLFRDAAATFQRFVQGDRRADERKSGGSLTDLQAFFEARWLFERGDLATFDRAKLIWFRDLRTQLAGPEIDAQFELWRRRRESTFTPESEPKSGANPTLSGSFSTSVLENNYDVFGTLTLF